MARDAISRQYDVEKNSMTLTCAEGKGSYRPGVITFHAKKGRSLDIDKIRESITATRLSGGTSMSVTSFEITATGKILVGANETETILKVAGTNQQFSLGEDPGAKGMLQKLREASSRGENIVSVTGQLPGWNGVFPKVLQALAKMPAESRDQLLVTGFEISKK